MKDYCVNILEQMGYHVLNPNQNELTIIDKGTYEPLIREEIRGGYSFRNPQKKFEVIYIYDDGNIKVAQENFDMNLDCFNDDEATYGVQLATGASTLKIMVRQYSNRDCDDYVADITLTVVETGTNSTLGRADINLLSDCCEIDSSNSEYEDLSYNDCKTDTIMNDIMVILKDFPEIEKSKEIQRGLKYIIPSFTKAVNDMLDYWKDYAIPKEIRDRRKTVEEYKDEIISINNLINTETQAIDKLNEILSNFEQKETKRK